MKRKRRVAGIDPRHEPVAVLAGVVLDLFRVGDDVVPGLRSLLRVQPGLFEDAGVPDKGHGFVVGRNPPGLAIQGDRLHGAGPEIAGGIPDVFRLQFGELPFRGELGPPENRKPRHHGRRVAKCRRAKLVKKVVVADILRVELDIRIGLRERHQRTPSPYRDRSADWLRLFRKTSTLPRPRNRAA